MGCNSILLVLALMLHLAATVSHGFTPLLPSWCAGVPTQLGWRLHWQQLIRHQARSGATRPPDTWLISGCMHAPPAVRPSCRQASALKWTPVGPPVATRGWKVLVGPSGAGYAASRDGQYGDWFDEVYRTTDGGK